MRRWAWLVAAACGGMAACGGKAIIDPPLEGTGGAGGTTGATTTSAVATTNVTATTDATTGPASDCVVACTALYQCGLEADAGGPLCPGFTGTTDEEAKFLYGNGGGGCVDSCNSLPAIIGLVDPDDCPGTIANFQGASADFADVCANGF